MGCQQLVSAHNMMFAALQSSHVVCSGENSIWTMSYTGQGVFYTDELDLLLKATTEPCYPLQALA